MTDLREEIAVIVATALPIRAADQAPAVADSILSLLARAGWQRIGPDEVVVPREPTEAMHQAAWDAYMRPGTDWAPFNAKMWAAMIAARPPSHTATSDCADAQTDGTTARPTPTGDSND